jgi:hypothetical protein
MIFLKLRGILARIPRACELEYFVELMNQY